MSALTYAHTRAISLEVCDGPDTQKSPLVEIQVLVLRTGLGFRMGVLVGESNELAQRSGLGQDVSRR